MGAAGEPDHRRGPTPLLYAGLSHCYRTEAGAAGRESRAYIRVHQFSKIEMFAFTHPDRSEEMHERMREIEERIYQDLEIPFRVVDICTGDLGSPAYRKYDLEAWMPGGEMGGNHFNLELYRLSVQEAEHPFKDKQTGNNRVRPYAQRNCDCRLPDFDCPDRKRSAC